MFPDYVKEYTEKINAGKIVASKRIKAVYNRVLSEIEEGKWLYDKGRGAKPIIFMERYCRHSRERWIGQPIQLELFQKADLQLIFGVIDHEGLRRFREVFWLMARKNGKSTVAAGMGLYMQTSDGEGGADVHSAATKKDQAHIVFDEATRMVSQSPALAKRIKKRKSDLYFAKTFSKFSPLASDYDTLDGLNPHLVIIDELHAIKNRELYEVLEQATTAREQPLILMITTNGTIRDCIFDEKYEYAAKVADGVIDDPHFLPLMYELDGRKEWKEPENWIKANPGIGSIKNKKTLADRVEKAKVEPNSLSGLLCKDFNYKELASDAWLSYSDIVNESKFDISEVEGTYAIGGYDLSSTTDLTCATLIIRKRNDPAEYVLQQYFLPSERVKAVEEQRNTEAPYALWAKQGWLTICADLKAKKINYDNNPILRMCLSNTAKKSKNADGVESIMPVKMGKDRRIDGTVSLLNARVILLRHYEEYMSFVR